MEDLYRKMAEDVRTIMEALLGNKLTKTGGMIKEIEKTNQRLDNIDEDIRELKKFKDRMVWTVMGLLTLGSALSWILSKIIELINQK
jgi:hypothetical protein